MRLHLTTVALAIASIAATTTNISDWEIFRFERGLFQIEMPALPAFSSQQLTTDLGDLKMSIFMHEGEEGIDDNILYMISFTDYPADKINSKKMDEATLDEYYKGSVQGSVSNMGGKLLDEKNIELFGHEAREIKIDYLDGQAVMRMQILLVENRMYALQTVALADNDDNADQKRFFNSFELLNE
ncbi:MAG: hypothetical protein AB8G11_15920 [Saprospiraceae bacterium]